MQYWPTFALFFLFTFHNIYASDNESGDSIFGSLQGHVEMLSPYSVNVAGGDFVESEVDLIIPSPEPLIINRAYDSAGGSPFSGKWYARSECLMDCEGHFDSSGRVLEGSFYVYEPSGGVIDYKMRKDKSGLVRPECYRHFCNNATGILSGQTNLKNHCLSPQGKALTVPGTYLLTTGDGTKRSYHRPKHSKHYLLNLIEKPNGNRVYYSYNKEFKLSKMESFNSQGNSLCSVQFNYWRKDEGYEAIGSNGQKVVYRNLASPAKYDSKQKYLCKVERPERPVPEYAYLFPNSGVVGVNRDVNGKLRVVNYPDGRVLQNEYYTTVHYKEGDCRIGKVKEQRAPLGADGQLVTVARYEYDHPKKSAKTTVVYNPYSVKKIYKLSRENRILSIAHYDQNDLSAYTESMVWGEKDSSTETFLLARKVENPQGAVLVAKQWIYDERGNVLEEQTIGDLTGNGAKTVTLDPQGIPQAASSDCLSLHHRYSNDGFNLLLETTDFRGVRTEYVYKQGTNLPVSKYTFSPLQAMLKREFYEYDASAQMTCRISDDGASRDVSQLDRVTERQIERISYNTYGKVACTSASYLDISAGLEKQLYRKEIEYNESAHPIRETLYDANGTRYSQIMRNYDDRGRLIEESDPLGNRVRYTYDANDNVICIQGPDPAVSVNAYYDLANHLVRREEVHADGVILTTTLQYDLVGNCISKSDPWAATTHLEFDCAGRVVKTIAPPILTQQGTWVCPEETRSYDTLGYATVVCDASGHATHTSYTVTGLPIEIQLPDGSKKSYRYSVDGKVLSYTTPNGETIHYEYDYFGREIATTRYAASGEFLGKTAAEYDALHLRVKTDEEGNAAHYDYDPAGRLIRESVGKEIKEFEYDSIGRLYRLLHRDGASWVVDIIERDALNRVIEERTEESSGKVLSRTRYAYDVAGNRITSVVSLQEDKTATTNVVYNSRREPIQKVDALGQVTTIAYCDSEMNGFRYRQQIEIDPLGKQTLTLFNLHGQIERIETRSAQGKVLALQEKRYTARLKPSLHEEHVYDRGEYLRTFRVRWSYGPGDRVEKETLASDTADEKTTCFLYDANGKLTQKIKPDGVILYHEYDGKGRLSRHYSPGSASVDPIDYELSYDRIDNLVLAVDRLRECVIARSYNEERHLATERLVDRYTLEYHYDVMGRKTATYLPDRSQIRYHYGALYLEAIERLDANGTAAYSHAFVTRTFTGKPLQMQTKGGPISFQYDLLERVARIESPHFVEEAFQYDPCGNLLALDFRDPLASHSCSYSYDELYQLIREAGCFDHSFKCDSLHNRLENDGASCDVNQLNQCLQQGGCDYRYDTAGNLVQKILNHHTLSCKYDALDRLVEITEEGNLKLQFTYDYFHRRVSKRVLVYEDEQWKNFSHLTFLYDGVKEIGAQNDSGAIVELRVLSPLKGSEMGSAVAHELDSTPYFPVHDHRGCVVALLKEDGSVAEFYRYSAFGSENIYAATGERLDDSALGNPWRFISKRTDSETGWVYFGRRYYCPTLGKWTTADPDGFKDGLNLYAYVHNRPLTSFDAFGLRTLESPKIQPYHYLKSTGCLGSKYEGEWETKTGNCFLIKKPHPNHSAPFNVISYIFSTSIQRTDHPNVFRVGYRDVSDNFRVTFTHGMQNNLEEALIAGILASQQLDGGFVDVICHPTTSKRGDVEKFFEIKNGSPEIPMVVANVVRRNYEEGYNTITIAHSLGGLANDMAFRFHITMEERTSIYSITLGSARFIDRDLVNETYNYVNDGDPVPPSRFCEKEECKKAKLGLPTRTHVEFLSGQTKSWNPIDHHAFDSTEYLEALKLRCEQIISK